LIALNVRFGKIVLRRGGEFRETVKQPLWMSLHQHQADLSRMSAVRQYFVNLRR
jgi:hypothetical protein